MNHSSDKIKDNILSHPAAAPEKCEPPMFHGFAALDSLAVTPPVPPGRRGRWPSWRFGQSPAVGGPGCGTLDINRKNQGLGQSEVDIGSTGSTQFLFPPFFLHFSSVFPPFSVTHPCAVHLTRSRTPIESPCKHQTQTQHPSPRPHHSGAAVTARLMRKSVSCGWVCCNRQGLSQANPFLLETC